MQRTANPRMAVRFRPGPPTRLNCSLTDPPGTSRKHAESPDMNEPVDGSSDTTAFPATAWWHGTRWSRMARLQALRWRQRLIFLLGGCVVGLAGVGHGGRRQRRAQPRSTACAARPARAVAGDPARFCRCSPVQGEAVPQLARQRHSAGDRRAAAAEPGARAHWCRCGSAIGKILLTLVGLLCGASIGREGRRCRSAPRSCSPIGRLSPRGSAG